MKMAKKKGAEKKTEPAFEEAMSRLEEIVGELEQEDLPLERSLVVFEEGIRLSRFLSGKLDEAEEKVEILLRDEKGRKVPRPFVPEEAEEAEEEGDDEDEGEENGQGEIPF